MLMRYVVRLVAIPVVPMALLAAALLTVPPVAQAATLERIKETGTIRIGYREHQPPMSFADATGQPVGYTIDLCTRIATAVKEELGIGDLKVEYVAVTPGERFEALISEKIDILCGATTKTLSRMEEVDFTQLTFGTGASLISLSKQPIANVGDLSGKKVAVVKDTTTIDALQAAITRSVSDAEMVPVASSDEGMALLSKGEVAAFAADQIVLVGLVIEAEDRSKFAVSRELFSYEPFALAVRRNDADFRLVADRVLSQLYRSEEIGAIYRKWFGAIGDRMPPLLEALYRINATPE
jgi:ABC-type amino acid transport substrate-binding protein